MTDRVDKKFFAALKSGDRKLIDTAFADVYNKYAKLIAFVVGKYVADSEVVKEIVNDTFIGFFNHAKSVDGNIKYYLSVSAKNNAITYLRKEKQSGVKVPLEYAESICEYEGREKVVDELLKVFSREQVDIIILHAVEGYTFKEIAKMTGKNVNTVITIYNRAIKKFKKENGNA